MAPTPDYNPYAPGRDDAPESGDDPQAFRPASLGRRFMGAMVDGLFNMVLLYAVRTVINGSPQSYDAMFGPRAQEQNAGTNLVLSLLPLAIMGSLVASRGQSLGKIVMRTRIVDEEGRRAGLYNGFVMRTLPFAAIALVPTALLAMGVVSFQNIQPFTSIIGLVSLVDAAMILGANRRCLHDRIAGTYVAEVGTERPHREDKPRRTRKKKRKAAPTGAQEAPVRHDLRAQPPRGS